MKMIMIAIIQIANQDTDPMFGLWIGVLNQDTDLLDLQLDEWNRPVWSNFELSQARSRWTTIQNWTKLDNCRNNGDLSELLLFANLRAVKLVFPFLPLRPGPAIPILTARQTLRSDSYPSTLTA